MTTTEQIEQVKHSLVTNKTKLQELRTERARLALGKGGVVELAKLDTQIDKLTKCLMNAPVEVAVLEDKLKEEQAIATQAEQDSLLEQQNAIAENIEKLSEQFIESLEKAKDINEQLRSALTAYAAIVQKTGQQVLGQYCQGSQESLSRLLELMEYQMAGQHTATAGPGLVGSNVPIRL